MFPIPNYGAIGPLFFLLGCGLCVATFFAWKNKLDERKGLPFETVFNRRASREEINFLGLFLYTLGSIVFLFLGLWMTIEQTRDAYAFRNLPVEQIKTLTVYRDNSDLAPLTLEDWSTIQVGMETLWKCRQYSKGRERFPEGYRIELVFQDPELKGYSLHFRRRDGSNKPTSYVSPSTDPLGTNLGEYDCREFGDWVKKHIDPPMANRPH